MKTALLAAMTLTAAIAFNPVPAFAHEGHDDEKPQPPAPKVEEPKKPADSHGHSHATKIPDSVEDIWKAIYAKHEKLVSTVAAKKLADAHDYAFAIRDLVKALPAKVPAESKAKAEEGAKEIAKLAADIDKSSAAGAQKTTEANVKKMGEVIAALQAKIQPSEVKN